METVWMHRRAAACVVTKQRCPQSVALKQTLPPTSFTTCHVCIIDKAGCMFHFLF